MLKRAFALLFALVLGALAIVGAAQAARPTSSSGLLPDIIDEIPKHLSIQNTKQREYLRFSTTHWNFGAGPLQVRGGGQVAGCVLEGRSYDACTFATQEILDGAGNIVGTHPAGVAVFHPEHNHWHQNAVANFAIRPAPDADPVGGSTLKTTFCLIDLDKSDLVKRNSERVYWECNSDLQGISPGWGDEYHHSTEGQELDITGLPSGVYYLTQDADPDQHWLESDETNNRAWVKFRLSRQGANPEVSVLDSNGYEGNTSNK
jgi:hypothetical protein